MEKKVENASPPPSVGDFDDGQSTYTVDQPPPAYRKPDLPAVKMTKIVAATVLIVVLMAGLTAVAIVYIQHNLKCAAFEANQQDSSTFASATLSELSPESAKIVREKSDSTSSSSSSSTTPASDDKKSLFPDLMTGEAQDQLKKLSFPIHIDMDELTGKMMEKNQRARLNCVIEKKKTEEIIPRSPKTLQTPFGNLTTDPKFTHVTGETMSLTCRSGNDRVTRPVTEKSAPILIQIPIHRGAPQQPQAPPRPSDSRMLFPHPPPHGFPQPQQMPHPNLHPQQHPPQPQQAPSHQINVQGPLPLNLQSLFAPQEQPPPPPQQHRMLNPFQQLRLPFMPFNQFPQMPLREVIPHLLEVHKQIQQQRQQEEEQQQQRNKAQQRQESEESNEGGQEQQQHPNAMNEHSQESQQQEQRSRGRAIPLHDIPLQRIPMPHPFMQPHPNQHLNGGPEPPMMIMHHDKPMEHQQHQQQQHQQQQLQQHQQQLQQQQQQRRHHSQEEEHEHQHAGGPEIHLEGAPSFHNDMPQIMPAEMMEGSGPLPFIIGSHNMQPRSSARPRMKRMAGDCSCVCK